MHKNNIKDLLDREVLKRNTTFELSKTKPDPLMVARKYKNEYISLICALFAYGNATQIVKFLSSLDYSLLKEDDCKIRESLNKKYYRFQNSEDVIQFFITMSKIYRKYSLEKIFAMGYHKKDNVIDGIRELINLLYDANDYRSKGYEFLIGKTPGKNIKSTYKRWNMYLRWMVREDNLDMGIWGEVNKKDLLIPLDTHTFNISRKLGLIKRKTYDFKAVLELTERLRKFDKNDPIKYDFAIYRLGQEKIV